MFRLSRDMSDRINFDTMIRNYLYEIRFIGTPQDVAKYHFADIYEMVDDIEEAEARILHVAKLAIIENLASELEKINGRSVKIYDSGSRLFGTFKNGIEAAEAVRDSDITWWKMKRSPVYKCVDDTVISYKSGVENDEI